MEYYRDESVDRLADDYHADKWADKIIRLFDQDDIDEDKLDNRPENLEVMTIKQHIKLYAYGK